MSLLKPGMEMEALPEQTMETTVQAQLLGEVRQVKNLVDSLRVAMLGGVHNEIETEGRLPGAEKDIRELKARTKSLEDDRIRWKAYVAAAAAIGGTCGAVIGFLAETAMRLIMQR